MDNENVSFTENVYRTVCPGCNMGCGVYMRELHPEGAETVLNIDYRKTAPTNEGKLCRFGVHMTRFYEDKAESAADGEAVETAVAVSAAAEALRGVSPENVVFLSVGNTTNEEHAAFMDLAGACGSTVSLGLSGLYKDIGKLHVLAGRGTTFDDVEKAKKIYLFTDPYIQYPLLMRHLVHAKAKGAEIIAFGVRKLPIACETVYLKPCASLYDVPEFAPDADSVVISDITPYTKSKRLAEILEISKLNGASAKTFFLKPFVNATGAGHLSRHTKQKSFREIIDGINDGTVKVLVTLDSDLINLSLNPEIADVLTKLEKLIVFTSRRTPVCEIADIVIADEPFYKKEGTVMNAEGRLIPLSAAAGCTPKTGISNINAVTIALGGKVRSFEELSAEVAADFGLSENDEFKVKVPEAKTFDGLEKVSDKLDIVCPADGDGTNSRHLCITNSFLWAGLEDDDDFIEIGRAFAAGLKLVKGYTADVTCACGGVKKTTRFKIGSVSCNFSVSTRKQPFAKGPVARVKIEPTPTKPQ